MTSESEEAEFLPDFDTGLERKASTDPVAFKVPGETDAESFIASIWVGMWPRNLVPGVWKNV